MRRSLAWLVAVPLMLGGSQLAHAIAYRIAYPQAHARTLHLLATGHSYLAWLPVVLGIAGACVLVSLTVAAADAARGAPPRGLPAWAFALLPPLAFAAQETLELSLHNGTFAWQAVEAPTFLPGLVLQLPVGMLVYLVARLLLRAAERLGRALGRPLLAPQIPHVPAAIRATLQGRRVTGSRPARAPPRAVLA